jgi:beta-lactamase superfamily II metal-dependent hydrolase
MRKAASMALSLPDRGFIFWPVGCGDSTTIKVNDNVVLQVDIRHTAKSEDDDEPTSPVVDELMDLLPEDTDGIKYLAVFALTHPDLDHCQGFKFLMEKVEAGELRIGELWFTPRIFREYDSDDGLSEDAQAFCDEATRRVKDMQGKGEGEIESGGRVMVIGNDDILDEDDYKDLPDRFKTKPGERIEVLDGAHLDGTFSAFIHAPFGDDSAGERNRTSLAMQVTLTEGDGSGRVLLFGDLDYPALKRIFDYSDDKDLAWDVLLAPHHCSKSAMYFQEEGDDKAVLKQDIVDAMADAAGETGWVVSSSVKVPATNDKGDNPPHAIAKAQYEAIAPDGFLCTGDDEGADDPIVFQVDANGITLLSSAEIGESKTASAVASARGGDEPHGQQVGFGQKA